MGVICFLAWRGLVARRRSLVWLVIAVAAGVGFQIPNSANLAGSSAQIVDEWLSRGTGDVRVEPRKKPRFAARDGVASLVERAVPGARAVPVIVLPGAIARAKGRFRGAPILGVDFAAAPLGIVGRAPLPGELAVVIGNAVARQLAANVGDHIELRVLLADPGAEDTEGGGYTVQVVGIARNTAAFESVFVDRSFLAQELADPGTASAIFVYLPDHDTAEDAARAIEAAIPDVRAIAWGSDDPFLPTVLRANRVIERVSLAMIVAAIAIPLLALSYISALRQRRDHALLRALGFSGRDIFAVQLTQSFIVGCLGTAVGVVLGTAAIAVFDRYPIFTWETLVVRPLVTVGSYAVPIAVGMVTAVLAGAVAAWRATRADPSAALKRLE